MTIAVAAKAALHSAPERASPAAVLGARQRLAGAASEHYQFVWRSLRRLGVPSEGVDDAAQQVFMVFAQRINEVAPGAEKSFLFRTAAHVALAGRRDFARRREVLDENQLLQALDPSASPEEALEWQRYRVLLDLLLDTLPEELRIVFVLAELEQLSRTEVAALLGLPIGTVASRLRRSKQLFEQACRRLESRMQTKGRR